MWDSGGGLRGLPNEIEALFTLHAQAANMIHD